MKSFDGYLKKKLGDSYVLLAGGGHKSVSDFATSSHTHAYLPLSGGTLTGSLTTDGGNITSSRYINIVAWPGYGEGTTGFWYNGTNNRWEGSMSNMLLNGNTVYHTGNLPAFVTAVGVGGIEHTNELYYTLSGTNNYLTVPYASTAPWSGISDKPFIRSPLWHVSNGWFRIASFNKHGNYGGWSNHGVLKAWSFNSNIPVMFRVNIGLNLARPTLTLVMFTGWDNVNGIRKIRIVCNSSYTSTQTAYLEVYATQNGDNYYFEYEGDDITFLQSPQAITTLESALDTVYTLELLKDGIVANNFYGNASSASVWKTGRTLTIGNTGKSVDGSGNVSWSLAEIGALAAGNYALSNHTHDQYFLSRGKATGTGEDTVWSKLGIKSYENLAPDGLTTRKGYYWGLVLSFPSDSGMRFDLWMTCYSSSTSSGEQPYSDGLYYRTGWSSNKRSWVEILDSHNYKDYMNPSIPISGNTIAVTVGGTTSSYITVPFSTNSTYTNYLSGYYSGSFHPGDSNNALYSSWTGSYYKLVTGGGYKTLVDYADNAGYAAKSTYVYADNSPYRVTDSSPYYMHMSWNTNSDSMWYLRAYPETPKTIAVDYAYKAPWSGITGKPSTYPPSAHDHNKIISLGNYSYANISTDIPVNALSYKIITSGGTDLGDSQYNVIHIPWSSGDWGTYIICGANNGRVGVKYKHGGAVREILDSGNYTNYCATVGHTHNYVLKTGDEMSGTLYINRGASNVPILRWNKSGTYWGGIGYGGTSNENVFGPVDGNGNWVTSTSPDTWTFRGNVKGYNFYTTSDRSKKQNISSFSEHIRKFQLKDTEKWHYGVIAQEVEEMFRDGEEGNMTVNYNSVLSYYVGELENRVKELEDKLKKYEEIQNI